MNNQNITVNPEELKAAANTIRKCIIDLRLEKDQSDKAWDECNATLGEKFLANINEEKKETDRRFNDAISKLDTYANSLDSISNIWQESEIEIRSFSNKFVEMFPSFRRISEIIEKYNKNNNQ